MVPDKNKDDPDANVGDPVSAFTGQVIHSVTDFRLMGRNGLDFEFTRIYRGDKLFSAGDLERTWTHNYNMYVIPPYGGTQEWLKDSDGKMYEVKSSPYLDYEISGNSYSGYTVIKKSEKRNYEFAYKHTTLDPLYGLRDRLYLTRITDRYGNNIIFEYTGGVLNRAFDSVGREVVFTSENAVINPAGKRITGINVNGLQMASYEYQNNRLKIASGYQLKCEYNYDSEGRLAYLKENKTPAGNNTIAYTYLNGRVKKMTMPEGDIEFKYSHYAPISNIFPFYYVDVSNSLFPEPVYTGNGINQPIKPYMTEVKGIDGVIERYYFGISGNMEKRTRGQNNEKPVKAKVINETTYTSGSVTDDNGNTTSYNYNTDLAVTSRVCQFFCVNSHS